jgi:hypothetical protein
MPKPAERLGFAQRLSALARKVGGAREAPEPVVTDAERAGARQQLFTLFESLGENCELGFAQEHFQANPIGLFRWSGINRENLVRALDTDLAGIGDPEHTVIGLNSNNHEFFVDDHRYGMSTHTRMHDYEKTQDEVFQMFCKRTRRLCEKLVEDLEDGAKIFVFQTRDRLGPDALAELDRAVHRIGPAAELLCIHPAEGGEAVGTVERLKPGLMLGLIDKPGFDGQTWDISFEVWVRLLATAAGLCGREVASAAVLGIS